MWNAVKPKSPYLSCSLLTTIYIVLGAIPIAQAGFLQLETEAVLSGCDFHTDQTPFELEPFSFNHSFQWNLPYDGWESQIPVGVRSSAELIETGGRSVTTNFFDIRNIETHSTFEFDLSHCAAAPGAHPSTSVYGHASGSDVTTFSDELEFILDPSIYPPGANTEIVADIRFTVVHENDIEPLAPGSSNFGNRERSLFNKSLFLSSLDSTTGVSTTKGAILFNNRNLSGGENEPFEERDITKIVRSVSVPLYVGTEVQEENNYGVFLRTELSATAPNSAQGQHPSTEINDKTRLILAPLPNGISCISSSGRFPGCEAQTCLSPLKPRDLGCGPSLQAYPAHILEEVCVLGDTSPIGAIEEIDGSATVIRANGTQEIAALGTPIYVDDWVKTDEVSSVSIAFVDETSMNISDGSCMVIEDYNFDAPTESPITDISYIRRLFVFTSGLVGRDDPDKVDIETPAGSLGIRGDASDYLNDLRRYPPGTELGKFGIGVETASPVGVTAIITPPQDLSTVSFKVAMLANVGDFKVSFGGVEKINLDPSLTESGFVHELNFDINPAHMGPTTMLEFSYDGPAGNEAVIWDVVAGDQVLDRESLFGQTGQGPVKSVVVATPDELERLRQSLRDARKKLIKHNQWELISIPGVALGATFRELFNESLAADDYATSWIMWGYDASAAGYVPVSPDDILQPGIAYWLLQLTGEDIELEIPLDLDQRNRVRSAQCPAGEGCYEIPLHKTLEASLVSWNLIGNPKSIDAIMGNTQLRYFDDNKDAEVSTSFENAPDESVLFDIVWTYNSESGEYESITSTDVLPLWQGAWLAVNSPMQSNIKWLVQ